MHVQGFSCIMISEVKYMEVIKVVPRGYCKGVINAILIAKKTAQEHPDTPIYVLGMLVHNSYVMQALKELHIYPVDDKNKTRLELLDEIEEGIVIFTAHGISPAVKEKALRKGLQCVDASCPDVVKTQDIVMEQLKNGCDVLYIGKPRHPEAEAVLSLSEKVHLISTQQDLDTLPPLAQVFVTNQTTMSIFDIEALFEAIRERYPKAVFCEEICNATRIRQQAVADLKDKQIDVLYVVGDRYSNNSNRLAQIARDQGIHQVYLIDDVNDIQDEQLCNAGRVAVTSGASTPTYLTAQVIAYLEDYAPGKCKPQIRLSEILS